MSAVLGRVEQARARSRVYGILARLLISGLDVDSRATLRALGGWLLDELEGPPPSLDVLAAAHHSCFGLELPAYAGALLDDSGRAGAWSDRVGAFYARAGFAPRLDDLTADELGVELAFASFVCGAAAEARVDGHARLAAELDRLMAEFLDVCVLSWLPALVVAAAGLGTPMWPGVLRETLAFAAAHRLALDAGDRERERPTLAPGPDDLLADAHTGLRRIAEHLLTPARSGVVLTRSDLAGLARARELPRGFGSRVLMLDNLLRGAVEYGALATLLGDLDALLQARDDALVELAAELELGPTVGPWRAALARTRELLARLAAASSTQDPTTRAPWTSKPSTTTRPAP